MSFPKLSAFLFSLMLLASSEAGAQCRPTDDDSYDFVETVKAYALPTDSVGIAFRDSLRIAPITSATSVTLVTKATTCNSANAAYQAATTVSRQTLSGQVYVVQVGKDYVVWDPAYRFAPQTPESYGRAMVFDSRWVLKQTFVR